MNRKMHAIEALAAVFLIMILFLQACTLLRKKNRCNDCPKWSYYIDKVQYNNLFVG